jgi:hypothetical protein
VAEIMGFLGKVDWLWFAAGMLFAIFLLPLISQMLGRLKANTGTKKVA